MSCSKTITLLVFVLLGLINPASADTVAATQTTQYRFGLATYSCPVTASNPVRYTSWQNTAAAAYSEWPPLWPVGSPSAGGCGSDTFTRTLNSSSLTGTTINYNYKISATTNSSSSTSAFTQILYTCPNGYSGPDANNQCTSTAPTCDLAVGTVLYSGYYDVGTSSTGRPPSIVCKNHCVGVGYTSGPDYTALVNGVKHYYYTGTYQIDPVTPQQNYCATDTPTQDVSNSSSAPSPTCPSGQAVGYVNGIAVCYDQPTPTTTPPPVSTEKKVESSTAPDGTKTETTTETAPDGSKTVTVVVTPPAGSSAPQTTTKTTSPPPDPAEAASYCQQFPDDPNCQLKHFTPGGSGSFTSKTSEIAQKRVDFNTLLNQIKTEAAALFSFGGSGLATLGCSDTAHVSMVHAATDLSLCFNKYEPQLVQLASAFVLMSYIVAAFILFA